MTPAPIAITMGEPAGIGGELTLMAWHRRAKQLPPFFAIDDPDRLAALAGQIDLPVPVVEIDEPQQAIFQFASGLPVLRIDVPGGVVSGQPSTKTAASVIRAIEIGAHAALAGLAGAVVTNPIQKKPLYDSGFPHPGHTEFLGTLGGGETDPVMMLAIDGLRVVPATVHIPLAEVADALTSDGIVQIGRVTAAALIRDFGVPSPRIAVAALNPHAGENGALGREEIDVIQPAITRLRAAGIDASGPMPADTLFHRTARSHHDAVVCMYHDQALIPLKTIDFSGGVNVTLGLPFVRTSPDHGTALDIAGTGKADPTSLLAALRMAGDMAKARARSHAA